MRVPRQNVPMYQCTKKNREKSKLRPHLLPMHIFIFLCSLSQNSLDIWTLEHSTPFSLANQALTNVQKLFTPNPLFVHWNIYNSPTYHTTTFAHWHNQDPSTHPRLFQCTNVRTLKTRLLSNLSFVPMSQNSCQIYCVVV